jgi:hypothetical protein
VPKLVDVPALGFLVIDGSGDPNTSERFRAAIQALYAVSYTIKLALKRSGETVHRVGPLECLWTTGGSSSGDQLAWRWTAMISQPEAVTRDLVEQAATNVADKKHLDVTRELRLRRFTEGPAAQVLHVGPYAGEGTTIELLHAFIREHGFALRGRHHEIYLSDPRRTPPERLRTIIRQPVTRWDARIRTAPGPARRSRTCPPARPGPSAARCA